MKHAASLIGLWLLAVIAVYGMVRTFVDIVLWVWRR